MYFLDTIVKANFGEIYIAKDENYETYFMAKDICNVLELSDEIKKIVKRLDSDEHFLVKRSEIVPISCMSEYM